MVPEVVFSAKVEVKIGFLRDISHFLVDLSGLCSNIKP